MNITQMNRALDALREKYSVARTGTILPGGMLETEAGKVTLLPWRVERRFVELRNIASNGTLEGISTLRFASITAGGELEAQLVREFDLAAWIVGKPVERVFAAIAPGGCAANVIAALEGGIKASIECSNKLPEGAEVIDRHEIIAARGVASDRCVDTQVPQSSLYLYAEGGESCYTDADFELFGFSGEEIGLVRAAFAVLSNPELGAAWNAAAGNAKKCARAVFESGRDGKVGEF